MPGMFHVKNTIDLLSKSPNLYFRGNVVKDLKKYIDQYVVSITGDANWMNSWWSFSAPAFRTYVETRSKKEGKRINEMFSDDSDSIHDMGIGIDEIRKQVTGYAIRLALDAIDDESIEILEKFFRAPIQHIYYLGDTYRREPGNIEEIQKAVEAGKLLMEKTTSTHGHRDEHSVLRGYRSGNLKIVTMHYTYDDGYQDDSDRIIQYVGDIYGVLEFDTKDNLPLKRR
jgi:hypothetical protein